MMAGLLLFASVAYGGGMKSDENDNVHYVDVKVKANEKKMVYVNFAKLQGKTVNIRVFDDAGELIHTEKIDRNDAVLKKYNLSDIPNGPYSFEVVDTQMLRTKFDQK